MKVLHINFSFTIGGIDNMMIDIMKHQLLKGVDVCLMIINDRVDKDVYNDIPKGVKVFLIRRPPSSKNVIYICKIYWFIISYDVHLLLIFQIKHFFYLVFSTTILGKLGLLKNKKYTCFNSMNEDFGGNYIDRYVVKDNNLITGKSAAATIDFAFTIVEELLGKNYAESIKNSIYYYNR